jgi:hypothetical protein
MKFNLVTLDNSLRVDQAMSGETDPTFKNYSLCRRCFMTRALSSVDGGQTVRIPSA